MVRTEPTFRVNEFNEFLEDEVEIKELPVTFFSLSAITLEHVFSRLINKKNLLNPYAKKGITVKGLKRRSTMKIEHSHLRNKQAIRGVETQDDSIKHSREESRNGRFPNTGNAEA